MKDPQEELPQPIIADIDEDGADFLEPPVILGSLSEPASSSKLLSELQRIAGEPKATVTSARGLDSWRKMARANELRYCDYGTSIWIPALKTRKIMHRLGAPWSPSELAKAYLKMQEWSFPLRRYETQDQVGPAVAFRGAASGDWHYVDLRACYWQIGQLLPWWVALPGKPRLSQSYLGHELGWWKRTDELDELRQIRLNLFGLLTYPGGSCTWVSTDGTPQVVQQPPHFARLSNQPWGTSILLVVHALATQLLERFPGVPLFHTDGALVPAHESDSVITWMMESWGLDARVKERGSGTVNGPGSYSWRKSYRTWGGAPFSTLVHLDAEGVRKWWLYYLERANG